MSNTVNSNLETPRDLDQTYALDLEGLFARSLTEFAFLVSAFGRARYANELYEAGVASHEIHAIVYKNK